MYEENRESCNDFEAHDVQFGVMSRLSGFFSNKSNMASFYIAWMSGIWDDAIAISSGTLGEGPSETYLHLLLVLAVISHISPIVY